jgi:hypothetical protein
MDKAYKSPSLFNRKPEIDPVQDILETIEETRSDVKKVLYNGIKSIKVPKKGKTTPVLHKNAVMNFMFLVWHAQYLEVSIDWVNSLHPNGKDYRRPIPVHKSLGYKSIDEIELILNAEMLTGSLKDFRVLQKDFILYVRNFISLLDQYERKGYYYNGRQYA